MKKAHSLKGVILLFFLLPVLSVFGQFDPATIPAGELLKGYAGEISGETISYHSFHPYATEALLTRATDGHKQIEWLTEKIPPDFDKKEIFFAWIAGFSSGTSAADRHFDLYINNEKILTFTTYAKKISNQWVVKGLHDAQLLFQQKSSDNVGDVYGNMYLKVPASAFTKGEPLRLKVIGEKAGSQDWYMTFTYEMSEKINIIPQLALIRKGKDTLQLIDVQIDHTKASGEVAISDSWSNDTVTHSLALGLNTIELLVPRVRTGKNIVIRATVKGLLSRDIMVPLRPVRFREFDFVSHSHNDIGYSDLQDTVAEKQIRNIRDAMVLIKKTAGYPLAARYRWNIESLWAVENFMQVATETEKTEFVRDVQSGSMGVPASYANELTGISRPEDLIRYTEYAFRLHRKYGIHFNTVMISDIPGISWAMVPALAQRGIQYISSGPNYVPSIPDLGDRVGYSNRTWGDKPFYWLSPSGKEKVLVWQAAKGYSWFHNFNVGRAGAKTKGNLMEYLKELESEKYPYDMVQVRYTVPADNGTTDTDLSGFVKSWNEKYVSPKIRLVNVSEMMERFDKRYHDRIPVYSGDYSPYWEDGAASTAKELAETKYTAERLNQAEILSVMLRLPQWNSAAFYMAWRDVVMFEEHTWGSWNSISDPDNAFTLSQWNYKKAFATDGQKRSGEIMRHLISSPDSTKDFFEVYNTASWNRTDLVMLGKDQRGAKTAVFDQAGHSCPSQLLSDGSLAFLASDVPALGSKKFRLADQAIPFQSDLKISAITMENGFVKVTVNPKNGSISSMIRKDNSQELADTAQWGFNEYLYVPGRDPSQAEGPENVVVRIKENGPLVVSLLMESTPPGAQKLTQEIRLIAGINRIDITDQVDKSKIREKEAVHFAFPFNIKDGKMKIDLGVGILEPEINQLPGSCRDFNCVQRWVDISNGQNGVTWTTREAPLIEIGEMINEELVNKGYKLWKKKTTLSSTFYSYVMNNYWHTNFKADQEGNVAFHYSLFPHDAFDAAACTRRGIESNQPLLVSSAGPDSADISSLFYLENKNMILSTLKPAMDGKGLILRIYNAGYQPGKPSIKWEGVHPKKIYRSNANQERVKLFDPDEVWPPFAFETLYLER